MIRTFVVDNKCRFGTFACTEIVPVASQQELEIQLAATDPEAIIFVFVHQNYSASNATQEMLRQRGIARLGFSGENLVGIVLEELLAKVCAAPAFISAVVPSLYRRDEPSKLQDAVFDFVKGYHAKQRELRLLLQSVAGTLAGAEMLIASSMREVPSIQRAIQPYLTLLAPEGEFDRACVQRCDAERQASYLALDRLLRACADGGVTLQTLLEARRPLETLIEALLIAQNEVDNLA